MNCTACTRPTTAGIHLCDTCADQLHATIDRIPDTHTELSITAAKLDNTIAAGGSTGGGGFNAEPPVRLEALDAGTELRALTHSWARMVMDYDTRQHHPHSRTPEHYLRKAVNQIRKHDFAGDMLHELDRATSSAIRLIDLPKDIRIYGTCTQSIEYDDGNHYDCGGQIKADQSDPVAHCHQCGAAYNVAELMQEMRDKTRGELMTVPQSRRWLSEHAGVKVTYRDIRNWIDRKHLTYVLARVTTTARTTKLVYPGDVLHVHHRMTDKRYKQVA